MCAVKIDTRQTLIHAAFDLICKSSYGSVGVDFICKIADVKKGSFYHFFPSKVDLAIAAMDAYWCDSQSNLDVVFDKSYMPVERFEKYSQLILEKTKVNQEKYGVVVGCPFTSLGSEMAGQDEKIKAKMLEISEGHNRYILDALSDAKKEGLLDDNVDLMSKANKIQTLIMGQLTMARIQNRLDYLERDLISGCRELLNFNIKKQ